ncbi:hypothetical protein ALC60_09435 [Trachymyrmex zeteki]|uniref:Uncharacterized protein n=1 Tax=Mycetomoellerius zeteki TaxID=64791 RepID=A0A151WUJ6_9HYME|nr:hypothetical protein ALC60_09435 [Trachymyrmex zeteki]
MNVDRVCSTRSAMLVASAARPVALPQTLWRYGAALLRDINA